MLGKLGAVLSLVPKGVKNCVDSIKQGLKQALVWPLPLVCSSTALGIVTMFHE